MRELLMEILEKHSDTSFETEFKYIPEDYYEELVNHIIELLNKLDANKIKLLLGAYD